MISVNNRLILEPYVKEGLKAKVTGGIAMPGQRDGLKGLKLVVAAYMPDGKVMPAGSIAYIREEVLYNHPWSTKVLTFTKDGEEKKCIIAPFEHAEMFEYILDQALIDKLTIKNG